MTKKTRKKKDDLDKFIYLRSDDGSFVIRVTMREYIETARYLTREEDD